MTIEEIKDLSLRLDGHFYYAYLRDFLEDILGFDEKKFQEILANGFSGDSRDIRTIKNFEKENRKEPRLKRYNLRLFDLYREGRLRKTEALRKVILFKKENPTCKTCKNCTGLCQPIQTCVLCDSCAKKEKCASSWSDQKPIVNCKFVSDICHLIDSGLDTRYMFYPLNCFSEEEINEAIQEIDNCIVKLLEYPLKFYQDVNYWYNLCELSGVLIDLPEGIYSSLFLSLSDARNILEEISNDLPSIPPSEFPYKLLDLYRCFEDSFQDDIAYSAPIDNRSTQILRRKIERKQVSRINVLYFLKLFPYFSLFPVRKVDIQIFKICGCFHNQKKQQEYAKKITSHISHLAEKTVEKS